MDGRSAAAGGWARQSFQGKVGSELQYARHTGALYQTPTTAAHWVAQREAVDAMLKQVGG